MKRRLEHWWNDTDRGRIEALGEESVPVPDCPSQMPRGLAWDRARASAVRGQRLTV